VFALVEVQAVLFTIANRHARIINLFMCGLDIKRRNDGTKVPCVVRYGELSCSFVDGERLNSEYAAGDVDIAEWWREEVCR
jgi:hypothetical protein